MNLSCSTEERKSNGFGATLRQENKTNFFHLGANYSCKCTAQACMCEIQIVSFSCLINLALHITNIAFVPWIKASTKCIMFLLALRRTLSSKSVCFCVSAFISLCLYRLCVYLIVRCCVFSHLLVCALTCGLTSVAASCLSAEFLDL